MVLTCAFASAAAMTWNHWGDLIIDSGRELDTPRQLAEGRMLYRDVRYWYGPFAPYLNATLYRVFGVNVQTLTTAGLVSAALLVWAAYRVCRLFTGRVASVAGAIAIIFTNIFGHYYPLNIFNFILPYSYPATYGMIAAVASLLALLRHIRKGRQVDFWLSCAALSITALCKLEPLFAAGVMHALFLGVILLQRRWKLYYPAGYLAALAIPALVYGYFYSKIGMALKDDNLFMVGNVSASGFTLLHSGLNDMVGASKEIGVCLAGYVACAGLIILASRARSISKGSAEAYYPFILISVLASGVIVYLLGPFRVLRGAPIVFLCALFYFGVRIIKKRRATHTRDPELGILFGFGLAGLSRILLRSGGEHYGFYLTVPAMLGMTVLWTRIFPNIVAGPGNEPRVGRAVGVVMLLAIAATHLVTTRESTARFYRSRIPVVRTSMGTMPILGFYLGSVDRAITELATTPGASVVVMPEGAAIPFLAGARNPLGVHTFLPVDFCGSYRDEAMIQRLREANPEFIVLNSRDVREYGKTAIGLDYGQEVMKWVEKHYEIKDRYQNPMNFAVVILKRKT